MWAASYKSLNQAAGEDAVETNCQIVHVVGVPTIDYTPSIILNDEAPSLERTGRVTWQHDFDC